ncbi:MAG TPA: glycosyltransferase, partial [Bryobacteraceae bacterium]|nr:glycosyltransferase [Bryobacteraceae bacterium]
MSESIKLAFASCSADLIPDFLESVDQLYPGLPLYVVAEFPPPRGQWIPWHIGRTLRDNIALIRSTIGGRRIRVAALLGQPRMPYWRMRLVPFLLAPLRTLVYNENLDHIALRPRSLPHIAKHFAWRGGNLVRWELRPGGTVYTWAWRLLNPTALRRPLLYRSALLAGLAAALVRKVTPPLAPPALEKGLPRGISVVIPSRNGRQLLSRLLPNLLPELATCPSEVIVSDNGSDDGTVEWLRSEYPELRVLASAEALSFARAANTGIAAARFDHTLLLNNDMVVEPGFFRALLDSFARVPDLFCATAQIFFSPGERRQETGKAVMSAVRALADFPVTCIEPLEAENLTPVLYGSGGCSLYDTAKLRALGGFDEIYEPAYVEDLDLGFRGWQQGWPTVFVGPARVIHHHRATTSRYHSEQKLARVLEINYLRFLARTIHDARLFRELWRRAVVRLNLRAVEEDRAALAALAA